jgi:uncharacterized phosphosugar-binding protein
MAASGWVLRQRWPACNIAQAIVCLASEELSKHGVRPPVLLSMNLDEGDGANHGLLEALRERIRGL